MAAMRTTTASSTAGMRKPKVAKGLGACPELSAAVPRMQESEDRQHTPRSKSCVGEARAGQSRGWVRNG